MDDQVSNGVVGSGSGFDWLESCRTVGVGNNSGFFIVEKLNYYNLIFVMKKYGNFL
jgi:hypothetical protein